MAGAQAAVAGTDLALADILFFCLWTVVGLFRLRRWARYSVVVVGILIFILAAISALMLVLRYFASAWPKVIGLGIFVPESSRAEYGADG